MQLRQGEDARPDTKCMSCHPTQSRQGEDARSSFTMAKLMSCHPMQLRQGEDARPYTKLMSCHPMQSRQGEDSRPSVKLMSYHPTQLRQGEDARHFIITQTETWRSPFIDYKTSDISEPLFATYPGETSVFRVHTIRMPPNLPRSRIAPWWPLHRQNRERNIYKSELDPKHAYYISYAWLL